MAQFVRRFNNLNIPVMTTNYIKAFYLIQTVTETANNTFVACITLTITKWWDSECKEVIRKRRKALKQFKRDKTDENYSHCKYMFAYSTQAALPGHGNSYSHIGSLIK